MSQLCLSHFVLVVLDYLAKLSLKVDTNLEVQVPNVPCVWLKLEDALDLLALDAGEVVLQVEDCLLPVGVGSLRSSGEPNSLVTMSELNGEVRDKSLKS